MKTRTIVAIGILLAILFAWMMRYQYVQVTQPATGLYKINRFTGSVGFIILTNEGLKEFRPERIEVKEVKK